MGFLNTLNRLPTILRQEAYSRLTVNGYIERLAREMFPGPTYLDCLKYIFDFVKLDRYLEIGVRHGASLVLAQPRITGIGVDPLPDVQTELPENVHIVEMTSSDFFASCARSIFGENKCEVVFLDGLHSFNQVLEDFINAERYCNSQSLIIIHDVLAVCSESATEVRKTSLWFGDVWKILPYISKYRPELNVVIVPTFPSGLAIISNYPNRMTESKGRETAESFLEINRYPFIDAGEMLRRYKVVGNSKEQLQYYLAELFKQQNNDLAENKQFSPASTCEK